MDVRALADGRDNLIAVMVDRGYSRDWIRHCARMVNFILENNEAEQWEGYADVYESYCRMTSSESVRKRARSLLAGIERFHREGKAPGDAPRYRAGRTKAYQRLLPEFKRVIDAYAKREADRGAKGESTINGESKCASSFLFAMQERGCSCMADIDEPDVLSFFLGPDGLASRRRGSAEKIRTVLRVVSDELECERVLAMIPRPKPKKNPMRGLADDDVDAIMAVLRSGEFSMRDRAIGLLLVRYGLRSSDVAGLEIPGINWKTAKLSIRQRKTDVPLELPLLPEVGNALYDYIIAERPKCDNPKVFQSIRRPYGPANAGIVYGVAVKLLDAAGVERGDGERRGSHVFRHRVATALLGSGEPQPVISAVLGHENPRSVEAYLSVDLVHLRECALSIERFPIPEEVFAPWESST